VTLPLIHLQRQETDGAASQIIRDIISSRSVTNEQWQGLLHALKEHASIDFAYRRAVEFSERARAVQRLPPSSERGRCSAARLRPVSDR